MAQPTPYTRQSDFSGFSATYPTTPHSGINLDAEFDAILTTSSETLTNLALLQRDDGALANGIVGLDQLASDINLTFNPPENWATATDYTTNSTVFESNKFYRCLIAHTSGVFADDLAASYWVEIADLTAAAIIDDGDVTNAKLADMAQATFKGRAASAGTGAPVDLTVAQARTILEIGDGAEVDNTLARWNGTDGALQGSSIVVDDSDNVSGVGTLSMGGALSGATTVTASGVVGISATSGLLIPQGTTAQRTSSPAGVEIRYNTTLDRLEAYYGSAWHPIGHSPGDIKMWMTEAAPTGWLELDGSAISRTTYAALYAIWGTTFGTGDGSTTFNIPDFQGRFVRGWDNGAGTDPDAASRTDRGDGTGGDKVGTYQADEIDAHTHTELEPQSVGFAPSGTTGGGWGSATGNSTTTGSTGGNETRPKNVAVMFCVKY